MMNTYNCKTEGIKIYDRNEQATLREAQVVPIGMLSV